MPIDMQTADPAPSSSPPPPRRAGAGNLMLLQEVEVRLSVEVGGTTLKIRDLLALSEGSVVELDRYASEMLDVLVNGTLLAKGEVVTVGDRLGVRVTEIVAPGDRLRGL